MNNPGGVDGDDGDGPMDEDRSLPSPVPVPVPPDDDDQNGGGDGHLHKQEQGDHNSLLQQPVQLHRSQDRVANRTTMIGNVQAILPPRDDHQFQPDPRSTITNDPTSSSSPSFPVPGVQGPPSSPVIGPPRPRDPRPQPQPQPGAAEENNRNSNGAGPMDGSVGVRIPPDVLQLWADVGKNLEVNQQGTVLIFSRGTYPEAFWLSFGVVILQEFFSLIHTT